MEDTNYVEVTDKSGWRKLYSLEKTIIYVGSDPQNDIVLDTIHGQGVAPRHLQLVMAGDSSSPYRAVNVGDSGIVLQNAENKNLPPRTTAEIHDGEQIQMGDFVLDFHLSKESLIQAPVQGVSLKSGFPQVDLDRSTNLIGLRIAFPGTILSLERPLEGVIIVCNGGNASRAQFHLDLEGLASEHYEMGAGPILYPQAEKTVRLCLYHPKQPQPPAGRHTIKVHATAPAAYPGVKATAVKEIEIQPYYRHELRILPGN